MKKWILANWKMVGIIILGIFLLWQLYAIRSDVSSIESDVSYIKLGVSFIESDVSYIKLGVSFIKSDVSYIKLKR